MSFTLSEAGLPMSDMGQCLTDSFTVTAPGSVAPPVICGTNDGQHSKLLQKLLVYLNNYWFIAFFIGLFQCMWMPLKPVTCSVFNWQAQASGLGKSK